MLPSQAAAALLWTLTASPLTATTGVSTAFTLVGTNGDLLSDIGCIRVTVPNASVHGASIIAVSNGRTWLTSVSGNTVWVQSQDGGGRLALLQSVTFRIQATPSAPGAFTWNANAYSQQDCAGTGSLLGVPPVGDWRADAGWTDQARGEAEAFKGFVAETTAVADGMPTYAQVIGAVNRLAGESDYALTAAGGQIQSATALTRSCAFSTAIP